MTEISARFQSLFQRKVKSLVAIEPLVTFRFLFGLLMAFSLVRFWANGWIEQLYLSPDFHFTYYGFHWVKDLGNPGMYLLFALGILSALGIAFGFFYRVSASLFFLSFTYIELIDKTTYLNHYYFVSLVSFLLIWLPAHRAYSVDVWLGRVQALRKIPFLALASVKVQLGLVYFLAGVAKLNPDWLLEAMPLKLWLPAQNHLPFVGWLFSLEATPWLFSWGGALYDLFIPFLLLSSRWRNLAYFAVLFFHLMTSALFQIGMFPYIMIGLTLVFYSAKWHQHIWSILPAIRASAVAVPKPKKAFTYFFACFFLVQLLIPFRFVLYPGNLFWTEEGYRFSWRVMLMEKSGVAFFYVQNEAGQRIFIDNHEYLSENQIKQLATQPDFLVQYAHHLKKVYQEKGWENPQVYADVFVSLNGRPSARFIDADVNLANQPYNLNHRKWVLPYPEPQALFAKHTQP